MAARPEFDPYLDPLVPAEVREPTIAEAKADADRYRALNASRTEWTGRDSRAFLTMLAARDGVVWVEAGRRDPEPERPAGDAKAKERKVRAVLPDRPCEICGTLFSPRDRPRPPTDGRGTTSSAPVGFTLRQGGNP